MLAHGGVSGLTSRAVTEEAGVAKGVMHHHFSDFDAFLAELILDRTSQLEGLTSRLCAAVGTGSIVDNLADALSVAFTPLAVAIVALVITRDGLRARLRDAGAARFPLLAETTTMVGEYLTAERGAGRIAVTADVTALSPTLIGSVHLLYTDRESGSPDVQALRKVVRAVMQGAK